MLSLVVQRNRLKLVWGTRIWLIKCLNIMLWVALRSSNGRAMSIAEEAPLRTICCLIRETHISTSSLRVTDKALGPPYREWIARGHRWGSRTLARCFRAQDITAILWVIRQILLVQLLLKYRLIYSSKGILRTRNRSWFPKRARPLLGIKLSQALIKTKIKSSRKSSCMDWIEWTSILLC